MGVSLGNFESLSLRLMRDEAVGDRQSAMFHSRAASSASSLLTKTRHADDYKHHKHHR